MKEQDTNLMEGDILTEEVASQSPPKGKTRPFIKLKIPNIKMSMIVEKILTFKKPRFISVLILFLAFVLTLTALIVLSSKKSQQAETLPDVKIATPVANSKEIEELRDIFKDLDSYDEKVNNLNDSIDSYRPPVVELNISF